VLALLFAFSIYSVHISRIARMYEMLTTGSLLVGIFSKLYLNDHRLRNLIYILFAIFFSISAHSLGIFLILIPLSIIFIYNNKLIENTYLSILIIVSFFYYFYYFNILQLLFPSNINITLINHEFKNLPFYTPIFDYLLHIFDYNIILYTVLNSLILLFVIFIIFNNDLYKNINKIYLWLMCIMIIAGLINLLLIQLFIVIFCFLLIKNLIDKKKYFYILIIIFILFVFNWSIIAAYNSYVIIPEFYDQSFFKNIDYKNFISMFSQNIEKSFNYPRLYQRIVYPLIHHIATLPYILLAMMIISLSISSIRNKYLLYIINGNELRFTLLYIVMTFFAFGILYSPYSTIKYIYFLFPFMLLIMISLHFAIFHNNKLISQLIILIFIFVQLTMLIIYGIPLKHNNYYAQASKFNILKNINKKFRTFNIDNNYRIVGSIINQERDKNDLILSTSAHQLMTYVDNVNAHLTLPHLKEYKNAKIHYFTGSILLRDLTDIIEFLEKNQSSNYVWICIKDGKNDYWKKLLYPMLKAHLFYKNNKIGPTIYYLSKNEFIRKILSVINSPYNA
jgi:hypothetical protein